MLKISNFTSFSLYLQHIIHLFRIRCIYKYITRPICAVQINSLVSYRIVYCSSLLYNLPASSIAPLHRINRSSIRSILNIKLSYHSSTDSFQLLPNCFPYKKRSLFDSFLLPINLYFSTHSYIYTLNSLHHPRYKFNLQYMSRYPTAIIP